MKWFPDFRDIAVFNDISLYQLLGFITMAESVTAIAVLICLIGLLSKSHHNLAVSLKHKLIGDAALMFIVFLMGVGGLILANFGYWQMAYLLRVISIPFYIYVTVKFFVHWMRAIDDLEP